MKWDEANKRLTGGWVIYATVFVLGGVVGYITQRTIAARQKAKMKRNGREYLYCGTLLSAVDLIGKISQNTWEEFGPGEVYLNQVTLLGDATQLEFLRVDERSKDYPTADFQGLIDEADEAHRQLIVEHYLHLSQECEHRSQEWKKKADAVLSRKKSINDLRDLVLEC